MDERALFTRDGESRSGDFSFHAVDHTRGFSSATFVATIGGGSAKYPADVPFRLVGPGETARAGRIIAVLDDGRVFASSGDTIVRNRRAHVTGWSEDVTNAQNQTPTSDWRGPKDGGE